MTFFRNKEIRAITLLLIIICGIAIGVAFIIGIACGILAAILCVLFCLIFFIFTYRRYKQIAILSEQLDIILHGAEGFNISDFDEGELSILQSEIQKMTVQLRENADRLLGDKAYLADSMADIAHQLRTPLTSINMIMSFLSEPDISEHRRWELLREAENLLLRIDWLITCLLKISKIDAGTAVFQKENMLVSQMIESAVQPLLIPIEIREIVMTVSGDKSAHFIGDFHWTVEALGNVIKNCMEHTDNGGQIDVSISENAIYTEIIISDNGSGIDKDDIPHIFERFYQGKHNKESSYGIGLALCRMILSAQNATIKAANRPIGGACFTIRFYHRIV